MEEPKEGFIVFGVIIGVQINGLVHSVTENQIDPPLAL